MYIIAYIYSTSFHGLEFELHSSLACSIMPPLPTTESFSQVHDNRPADVEAPAAPDVERASCRESQEFVQL